MMPGHRRSAACSNGVRSFRKARAAARSTWSRAPGQGAWHSLTGVAAADWPNCWADEKEWRVSDPLEKAKRLAAAGKYRAVVDSLRYAEPIARAGDLTEVRAILELVAAIRDHADRRVQQECDEIADSMRDVLDRESGPGVDLSERAMVFLSGCLVIGGAGLHVEPDTNRQWNLAFTKA